MFVLTKKSELYFAKATIERFFCLVGGSFVHVQVLLFSEALVALFAVVGFVSLVNEVLVSF